MKDRMIKLWKHYKLGLLVGLLFNLIAVWTYPDLIRNIDYINGIKTGVYNLSTINWCVLSLIYLFIQAPFFSFLHYKWYKGNNTHISNSSKS